MKANKLLMLLVERKAGDRSGENEDFDGQQNKRPELRCRDKPLEQRGQSHLVAEDKEMEKVLAGSALLVKLMGSVDPKHEVGASRQKSRRGGTVSGRSAARNDAFVFICASRPA